MKRWAKSAIFFTLYYLRIEWLLAKLLPSPAVAVLMYHGVCDDAPIPPQINFHVGNTEFLRQMRALKSRYDIISLGELVAKLRRGERLKKAVVLTFDDGYRNNAEIAFPILRQLRIPATVFIASHFVDSGTWIPLNQVYWAWATGAIGLEEMIDYRTQLRSQPSRLAARIIERCPKPGPDARAERSFAMLTWQHVTEMAAAGIDFGSHTETHCNMAIETAEDQQSELLTSKSTLERILGKEVLSFAYPYGAKSKEARDNVIRAGFECALSTETGLVTDDTDVFDLPRVGHDPRIWMFTGELLHQFIKAKLAPRYARTSH